MMFLAIKTEDGVIKGKITFYCRMLKVTRQRFYKYLANRMQRHLRTDPYVSGVSL